MNTSLQASEIKVKVNVHSEQNINEAKRSPTEWNNIFANDTARKGASIYPKLNSTPKKQTDTNWVEDDVPGGPWLRICLPMQGPGFDSWFRKTAQEVEQLSLFPPLLSASTLEQCSTKEATARSSPRTPGEWSGQQQRPRAATDG